MAGEEGGRFNIASRCVALTSLRDLRLSISADTGEPVFLPFRMSCYIFSNLVVTAGMLTPGLQVGGMSLLLLCLF